MTIADTAAPVVVTGIDFSEPSDRALDEALRIAGEHPGGRLHVVHVISSYGPMLRLELASDTRTVSADEALQILQEHVATRSAALSKTGVRTPANVTSELRGGNDADGVVDAASEREADLIVVGTHGRTGVRRLLLGSVAEAIVRQAGCSVLVVRDKSYEDESAP